jgi:phosphatidylinositol glycan class B
MEGHQGRCADEATAIHEGPRDDDDHRDISHRGGGIVLLLLIAFRFINALSVVTFFQPDEYFQSLEPAWEIAFGSQSGAWITWVGSVLAW